jgi:hypothetical protein
MQKLFGIESYGHTCPMCSTNFSPGFRRWLCAEIDTLVPRFWNLGLGLGIEFVPSVREGLCWGDAL